MSPQIRFFTSCYLQSHAFRDADGPMKCYSTWEVSLISQQDLEG